jgi:glycosyltransferase involved in cell wall biosynthesis
MLNKLNNEKYNEMKNPLVTISIPVYNVEKDIERALKSALNQTYKNLEILVVDDKGIDKSMTVVRDVLSQHPRRGQVRIISHDNNSGTGAVRNTSIDKASGEYIYFMDGDDCIVPDTIDYMVHKLGGVKMMRTSWHVRTLKLII